MSLFTRFLHDMRKYKRDILYLYPESIPGHSKTVSKVPDSVNISAKSNITPILKTNTKKMFSTTNKDVLPMTALSNVIYLFTRARGYKYIGKTTWRLDDSMKQRIPNSLVQLVSPTAPPVRHRGRPP